MLTAYFKLFRVQNLLIIVLIQFLLKLKIIDPILKLEGLKSQISMLDFSALVLSTVFIAAAGYIINDYFDIRIDRINRPDKIVLGKKIPLRRAIFLHTAFNIIGCLIGLYVAYKVGKLELGFIQIAVCFGLWFYSLKYKRQMISGNLVVAVLAAFVILIVYLFEFFALVSNMQILIIFRGLMNMFIFSFAIFAFITTIIREIIKDMEDIEGDSLYKCQTLPIRIGIKKSKIISIVITIIAILLLAYGQYQLFEMKQELTFWFLSAVQILFIYLIFSIIKAKEKKDFNFAGNIAKIIMLAGIISLQTLSFGH